MSTDRIAIAACGALSQDITAIATARSWPIDVHPLPPLLHNQPQKIAYAVILMPGGGGQLNPRLEDGKLVFAFGGNFLIRSRTLFADNQFVAASTNSTTTPGRVSAASPDA